MTIPTKYPRTMHFPWSPGLQNDDRVMDFSFEYGTPVVITEKMDGENTSMYRDYIHSRSLSHLDDTESHPSRIFIGMFHQLMRDDIPDGWRVCGENLYSKHSIHYTRANENALQSFFQVFSIWNEKNECLTWGDTKEWAELLGFATVPVIYEGPYTKEIEEQIKNWDNGPADIRDKKEGYVVRIADSFPYKLFPHSIAKYVRKNHVQTVKHWFRQPHVQNELENVIIEF